MLRADKLPVTFMKFLKLSTTSKLYLFTLLIIFGFIFLNQSVFAQSGTRSDKRMTILERYLTWVNNGEYGTYNEELGKKTLSTFTSYISRIVPENQACLKETDDQKLLECKLKIKEDFKLARKYNRVLKYLQIQEGKPNVCVKADMGIGVALRANAEGASTTPEPGVESELAPSASPASAKLPVYLCTDSEGKKLVRVFDSNGALLKLAPNETSLPQFQPENLPPKDSFDLLQKKLGLTPASGEIFASPNPCTIPAGAQTCGEVEVEWDVTDETSDPVEVKTEDGALIERSRNGSADILDIGPQGKTFMLYSLGRKIGEVFVKANKQ